MASSQAKRRFLEVYYGMKKVGNWFAASWMELLLFVAATAGISGILWFSLGDMVPGLTTAETTQAATSNTIRKLIENPIGAPHKALQFVTQKVLPGAIGIRSASALIGLFATGCFYFVLRNWYSRRVAFLGTLTLVTSAWFLHTVRSGTDSSMYLLLFGAAACITWLQKSRGKMPAVLASAVLVIMLLYIPGMIWLVAPALLWQAGTIAQLLERRNAVVLTIATLLAMAALTPLGSALYQNHDLIKTYFGLPQTLPEPVQVARNIANVPIELFARGPNNPGRWLGRMPLLNLFATVMFVVGVYAYIKKRKLDRTPFTVFVFIAGTVLVAIGGPVSVSLLLPFVYVVVAGGIALLLQQWRTVFPRNPFARTTGTILLTIVTVLAAYQGIRHYFIAWPNTPETKHAHHQQLD